MGRVYRLQHASVPMPPGKQQIAREFYAGVLGMRELRTPPTLAHLGVVWFQASDDGDEVHIYEEPSGGARAPGQHLCLLVDDIEALSAELTAQGVEVQDTIDIPGRPRRVTHDPFGNQIELVQMDRNDFNVPMNNAL